MKIKVYIEREKVDKNLFRNARGERYPFFFNLRTSGSHLYDYSTVRSVHSWFLFLAGLLIKINYLFWM